MALLRPLPETDGLAQAYWHGVAAGKLMIQRCEACGHHQHYGRPFCLECGAAAPAWIEARGTGKIWSFTAVHRGPYEDIPVPYVVALVRLNEGVVILSHIVDCQPEQIRCDMPVTLSFQAVREGISIPVFRLASQEAA